MIPPRISYFLTDMFRRYPTALVAGSYPLHLYVGSHYSDIDVFVSDASLDANMLNFFSTQGMIIETTYTGENYEGEAIYKTFRFGIYNLIVIYDDYFNNYIDTFDLDICKVIIDNRLNVIATPVAEDVFNSGICVYTGVCDSRLYKYQSRFPEINFIEVQ